jgi:hypothetical protein
MLFEIFFDPMDNLRQGIKKCYFNEVCDLQRFDDLESSFDFIANALRSAGATFPETRGIGYELNVNVVNKKKGKTILVDAIFVGGKDLLILPESDWDALDIISPLTKTNIESTNAKISDQLAIPLRLLKTTYTPATISEDDQLVIPRGWRVVLD